MAVTVLMLLTGLTAAYARVFVKLVTDWSHNPNYSHGFLIIPLALYLVWERRQVLRDSPAAPSIAGLGLVAAGMLMLATGTLGAELFLTRLSLLLVLAGIVLFLLGPQHLRVLGYPLAFLLLMIPLPTIIFNQIAFPLQLIASGFGETVLWMIGIPVFREGNLITLATTTLEVADACSGIRSLVSLLTLTVVYSHFTEPRRSWRLMLIASTLPIAIVTNGLRVAAIGVAAHYQGADAAEGLVHDASGWLVFVAAIGLIPALHRSLGVITPVVARAKHRILSGAGR